VNIQQTAYLDVMEYGACAQRKLLEAYGWEIVRKASVAWTAAEYIET
jgi:hypothetical protein